MDTPRPAAAAFMARTYPRAAGHSAKPGPKLKKLLKRVSSARINLEVLTMIGMFHFTTVDPSHIDHNIAPVVIAPTTKGVLYLPVDQIPPVSKPTIFKRTLARLKNMEERADEASLRLVERLLSWIDDGSELHSGANTFSLELIHGGDTKELDDIVESDEESDLTPILGKGDRF